MENEEEDEKSKSKPEEVAHDNDDNIGKYNKLK